MLARSGKQNMTSDLTMRFSWKVFLTVTFVFGTYHTVVMAATVVIYSNEEMVRQVNNNKEAKVWKGPSTQSMFGDNVNNNVTNTADLNAKSEKKHKDVWMRMKRSVSTNATEALGNATATDLQEEMTARLRRRRSAAASLTEHFRNLPESREQAPPLVYTENGEVKIPLYFSVDVLSILEVNDIRQSMKSSLHVYIRWQDEALAWNASLYEGTMYVVPSPGSVWIPRVYIPNSLDVMEALGEAQYIVVSSGGWVYAENPFLLESSCSMDLTWYPYDEQTCAVKFLIMSEIYEWRIDENAVGESTTSLALSSEWEVLERFSRTFLHNGNPSPEVVVKVRRKTTFYIVCLVLPMVVTSYMSVLVFLVPPQSGEKISFLVTLCVSTSVYVSFFTTTMPRGLDTVPVSMKLLIGVIVESILVLMATILVLRRFHAEQEASADYDSNQRKGSINKVSSIENHPGQQPDSNIPVPPHTTEPHPQSLQDLPQSGGVRMAWLSSRSPSVTPLGHAGRASRATRFCGLRGLTSRQLDRILFIIFLMGNSIFLLVLMHNVRQ